jgi:hypothetical protein
MLVHEIGVLRGPTDVQKDVKVLFLWIRISMSKIDICSDEFPYSLFSSSKWILKFYFKFIWIKSLNQFPRFYLWESLKTFIQIQAFIEAIQTRHKNSKNKYPILFQYSAQSLVIPHWFFFYFSQRNFWPIWPYGPVGQTNFPPTLNRGSASRHCPLMAVHPAATPSALGNQGASPRPLPRTDTTRSPPLLETKTWRPWWSTHCHWPLKASSALLPTAWAPISAL